jgi:hypothetical protein
MLHPPWPGSRRGASGPCLCPWAVGLPKFHFCLEVIFVTARPGPSGGEVDIAIVAAVLAKRAVLPAPQQPHIHRFYLRIALPTPPPHPPPRLATRTTTLCSSCRGSSAAAPCTRSIFAFAAPTDGLAASRLALELPPPRGCTATSVVLTRLTCTAHAKATKEGAPTHAHSATCPASSAARSYAAAAGRDPVAVLGLGQLRVGSRGGGLARLGSLLAVGFWLLAELAAGRRGSW